MIFVQIATTQEKLMAGCNTKNEMNLAEYLTNNQLGLLEYLSIGRDIASELNKLHDKQICYSNLNPSNIRYCVEDNSIRLAAVDDPCLVLNSVHRLELEELCYLSPEQSLKVNQSISSKSDLYSLGIVLYEMLTSRLPFATNDPIELLYAHIAKSPELPSRIKPELPVVVSNIVMKLISKAPDSRYQSAFGIKFDLEKSLSLLQLSGEIACFELGQKDISDTFMIPDKLYGRENEIKLLSKAYENIRNGKSETVFVAGYSGVGKSSLVYEIKKSIRSNTLYISGKFDQYSKDRPYSALLDAFTELTEKVLSFSQKKIEKYKEGILNAVGGNGQLLTSNIPKLELIIGPQQDVAELAPLESKNRFRLLIHDFLKTFISAQHPMILFLDDLQWADTASLELLNSVVFSDDIKHLLFIGAFRDNEINKDLLLDRIGDEIKENSHFIKTIQLQPLSFEKSNQLVSETLKSDKKIKPLTELCLSKTEGNPFFLKQFLHILNREELIFFDREKREWDFDIEIISKKELPDNIIEMMVYKITKLKPSSRELLKIASCIGSIFNVYILATIINRSVETVIIELRELSKQYLIQQLTEKSLYAFSHDRIEQASYSLLTGKEKKQIYLQVGRLILKDKKEIVEEQIFDVVHSLNAGLELITEKDELDKLAELNLKAAKKAKKAAALQAVYGYLHNALNILGTNSWETKYELTLAVYLALAEAAYLNNKFAEMDSYLNVIFGNSRDIIDKAKAYEIKINAYASVNDFKKAISIGRDALKPLGFTLPETPSIFNMIYSVVKIKILLFGKNIEELVALPEMTDKTILAIAKLLHAIGSSAFLVSPKLLYFITLKHISLCIKHGNTTKSASEYCGYGLISCVKYQNFNTGYKFGKLALKLIAKLNVQGSEVRTIFVFYFLINIWKKPVKDSLSHLHRAYLTGLKSGDLEYSASSIYVYYNFSFFTGSQLNCLFEEMNQNISEIENTKQQTYIVFVKLYRQLISNLLSDKVLLDIDGIYFDEIETINHYKKIEENDLVMFTIYFMKAYVNYFFGHFNGAMDSLILTNEFIPKFLSHMKCEFFLYESLIMLALFNDVDKSSKRQYFKKISANQKQMKKWAKSAPMNFLHKFCIVEAEINRVKGKNTKAADLYDQAINLANKNQYVNEEALANELAAKFYLTIGKDKIAQVYFSESYRCYQQWGAKAKLLELKNRYPAFFTDLEQVNPAVETKVTSSANQLGQANLRSLIKASKVIANTTSPSKSLQELMHIAIEHSGATSAALLLNQEDNYYLAEYYSADTGGFHDKLKQPLSVDEVSATAIVNYVIATKEPLVVANGQGDPRFSSESIQGSVLCMPIIHQGIIVGVLYLENKMMHGIFAGGVLDSLHVIASQMPSAIIKLQQAEREARQEANLTNKVAVKNPSESKVASKYKYGQSRLSEQETDEIYQQLTKHMEQDLLYKNALLTLQQVADNMALTTHSLSQAINLKSNLSFNAFVNRYRLLDVKTKLIDPAYKDENTLNLALDSGFNSKSVFYSTFKNSEGVTPAKYRQINHQCSS